MIYDKNYVGKIVFKDVFILPFSDFQDRIRKNYSTEEFDKRLSEKVINIWETAGPLQTPDEIDKFIQKDGNCLKTVFDLFGDDKDAKFFKAVLDELDKDVPFDEVFEFLFVKLLKNSMGKRSIIEMIDKATRAGLLEFQTLGIIKNFLVKEMQTSSTCFSFLRSFEDEPLAELLVEMLTRYEQSLLIREENKDRTQEDD